MSTGISPPGMSKLPKIYEELFRRGILASIPVPSCLRAMKALELSLNLASALGISKPSLLRIQRLIYFAPLLCVLKDSNYVQRLGDIGTTLCNIFEGKSIVKKSELEIWQAILRFSEKVYSTQHNGSFPYPLIQVEVQDKPVLCSLIGTFSLEELMPAVLAKSLLTTSNRELTDDGTLLLAHYDPHGFAMLASTYLSLQSMGISVIDYAIDYNETGDYGKFWKRTLPRYADSRKYKNMIILDLSIHARAPERTLQGISFVKSLGINLILVDHHADTILFARKLAQAGCRVVLADIPGCFYGKKLTDELVPFVLLGCLGDKDATLTHIQGWWEDEALARYSSALNNLERVMYSLSPPPKELRKSRPFPLTEILAAYKDGGFSKFARLVEEMANKGFSVKLGQDIFFVPPEKTAQKPTKALERQTIGKVLLVIEPLNLTGRKWYKVLEDLLELESGADYAIAGRYLVGSGFNFLCLKKGSSLISPPPLAFVPSSQKIKAIGHHSAFWMNLRDEYAVPELSKFVRRINRFYGLRTGRVSPIVQRMAKRLLEARVRNI